MSHSGGERRSGISDHLTAQDARQGGIKRYDAPPRWPRLSSTPFTRSKGGLSSLVGGRLTRSSPMRKFVLRFLNDDSGATAIEYGLIAAGISVAIIAVVNTLGTNLNATFTSISSQLK
jgi:pilus assembly protein Flp/PilA